MKVLPSILTRFYESKDLSKFLVLHLEFCSDFPRPQLSLPDN